jgi:hypothetical protein
MPTFGGWLDAYESEALLGVCSICLKRTKVLFSLPKWEIRFYTFLLYLSHPASTVRQEASKLFRVIISLYPSDGLVAKLILQSLSAQWKMHDPAAVGQMQEENFLVEVPLDLPLGPNITFPNSNSWEWKEGRLLSYELILKFMVSNHIHYFFPFLSPKKVPVSPPSSPLFNSTYPPKPIIRRSVSEQSLGAHDTPSRVTLSFASVLDRPHSANTISNIGTQSPRATSLSLIDQLKEEMQYPNHKLRRDPALRDYETKVLFSCFQVEEPEESTE